MAESVDDENIDVVIPARGRADLVERALGGVLSQTLAPRNIFVIDDGSPVPLASCLNSGFLERCRVIRCDPGQGGGAARNVGIEACSSEWIAFLDSDDWWEPRHLHSVMRCASAFGADAIVGAYRAVFGGSGELVYRSGVPSGVVTDFAEYMFLGGGLCRTSTFLVHRDRARAVKFDNGGHEDWDFMLRLSRGGRIAYDDSVTVEVDHDAAGRFSRSRDPEISFRFLAKHHDFLTREQRNGFRLRAARSAGLHADSQLAWGLIRGFESPLSTASWLHAGVSLVLGLHPWITAFARSTYLILNLKRPGGFGRGR